jgi:hypothetical protein
MQLFTAQDDADLLSLYGEQITFTKPGQAVRTVTAVVNHINESALPLTGAQAVKSLSLICLSGDVAGMDTEGWQATVRGIKYPVIDLVTNLTMASLTEVMLAC